MASSVVSGTALALCSWERLFCRYSRLGTADRKVVS
jgi:hypothetical protein